MGRAQINTLCALIFDFAPFAFVNWSRASATRLSISACIPSASTVASLAAALQDRNLLIFEMAKASATSASSCFFWMAYLALISSIASSWSAYLLVWTSVISALAVSSFSFQDSFTSFLINSLMHGWLYTMRYYSTFAPCVVPIFVLCFILEHGLQTVKLFQLDCYLLIRFDVNALEYCSKRSFAHQLYEPIFPADSNLMPARNFKPFLFLKQNYNEN